MEKKGKQKQKQKHLLRIYIINILIPYNCEVIIERVTKAEIMGLWINIEQTIT
jgi:preprotein translocase subunit SecB